MYSPDIAYLEWLQDIENEPYQEHMRDSERNDDYTDWDYMPEAEDIGEEEE